MNSLNKSDELLSKFIKLQKCINSNCISDDILHIIFRYFIDKKYTCDSCNNIEINGIRCCTTCQKYYCLNCHCNIYKNLY